MKKYKIFALPSHQSEERTSAVDFLRIIQPMKHLGKEEDFEVTVWDPTMNLDWPTVAQEYDAIYFSYLNSPWGFAVMGAMARNYGKKLIMDIDDNLWDIKEDNPAYSIFKKGSEGIETITAIANEVDYITCTNDYLKNVIIHNTKKNHDNTFVFDNYIDLELYSHKAADKNTTDINIGHFGSTTHFTSLANSQFVEAMDKLMQDYPNVTFTTIGSFLPDFKNKWGQRYVQKFGDVDVYKWVKDRYPGFADDIDFFVTPLTNDVYNQSKSDTKFNEVSSTGRPGVWQNIRQYRQAVYHGTDGLLAIHTHEWYDAMKKLCDSYDLRKKMGEAAYKKVQGRTIQGHIGEYKEFFTQILSE